MPTVKFTISTSMEDWLDSSNYHLSQSFTFWKVSFCFVHVGCFSRGRWQQSWDEVELRGFDLYFHPLLLKVKTAFHPNKVSHLLHTTDKDTFWHTFFCKNKTQIHKIFTNNLQSLIYSSNFKVIANYSFWSTNLLCLDLPSVF